LILVSSIFDNSFKEQILSCDQPQIKEETHIEIPDEKIISPNLSIIEQEQTPIASPSLNNILSDHQSNPPPPPPTTTTTIIIPESSSSSRSTSRTSSETKTDIIKVK
jgi:hypothetical protein